MPPLRPYVWNVRLSQVACSSRRKGGSRAAHPSTCRQCFRFISARNFLAPRFMERADTVRGAYRGGILNKYTNYLIAVVNVGAVAIAILVFLQSLMTAPTGTQDASGMAGSGAALIALCTAVMLLIGPGQRSSRERQVHRLFIGICAMSSAYLWIAAESEIHPSQWELPSVLAAFAVVGAFFAVVIIPFVLIIRAFLPVRNSSGERDDGDPLD